MRAGSSVAMILFAQCGCMMAPAAQGSDEGTRKMTAPQVVRGDPDGYGGCYPIGSPVRGREGVVTVEAVVHPDGAVSDPRFPPGTERWQQETAACVMARMKFRPETVDRKPVAAE